MLTRRTLVTAMAMSPAILIASRAAAMEPDIYAEDGIAIDGTDAVAYFTEGRPVVGDPAITHMWKGATWRFASAENRDLFAADPERYAPQYGGYCAFAAAEGYIAPTVPDAWTVHDGKLYLHFSRGSAGAGNATSRATSPGVMRIGPESSVREQSREFTDCAVGAVRPLADTALVTDHWNRPFQITVPRSTTSPAAIPMCRRVFYMPIRGLGRDAGIRR